MTEEWREGVLRRSARELDPEAIAPRVAWAMGLGSALVLAMLLLLPSGPPLPPVVARMLYPTSWGAPAALGALMLLGAGKRCFGFGAATWLGVAAASTLALCLPLLPMVAPPLAAVAGALAVGLGFAFRESLVRWRYATGAAVGAFGLWAVMGARVAFFVHGPPPPESSHGMLAIAAAWVAVGVGLAGALLVGLTARRGQG